MSFSYFPTYAVSTELDAVNQILSSVGQAPVNTLDIRNPEIYIIIETIKEVTKQILIEGWTFNTERGVVLAREASSNRIPVTSTMLSVDINDETHKGKYDIVVREGYLYDRISHTNEFLEDITADIVWAFDYRHLPSAVQSHIVAKAARICAIKMVGDSELNQLLAEQEATTRASLIEAECQQGDYSMFGFKDGENYYTSYQPFHALFRQ